MCGSEGQQAPRPPGWLAVSTAAPKGRSWLCATQTQIILCATMSIHIENLTINRLELHTGAEHGQEQEAEGSSSGPAATVGSAPTTPQALGWRRDGGDAAAELTWQLLAAPPPEPPSSADAGEAPEAEGSPPYWDDSGPREPELKPGSPEWGLHRTPSQARLGRLHPLCLGCTTLVPHLLSTLAVYAQRRFLLCFSLRRWMIGTRARQTSGSAATPT